MKGSLSFLALPLLAVASPMLKTTVFDESIAPLLSSENAKHIPDSYIIVLKKHVTQSLAAQHHDWVSELHTTVQNKKMALAKRSQFPFVDNIFEGLKHTYNIAGSVMGYSGHFDEDVIEQIRKHPDVSRPTSPKAGANLTHLPGRVCREGPGSPHPGLQGQGREPSA